MPTISGAWGQALNVPILFHQRAYQVGVLPFVWEWSLLCCELMAKIGCSFRYFPVFSFSVQLLPLFISRLFLFLFLPRYLSTFLSVSGCILVCLTTSPGCSAAWLSLCFSLSLSLSFPIFSLSSVCVTSFLCLSVSS